MPTFSIVVCTRNPHAAYFTRCLGAIAEQTAATRDWELLIVDNGSENPLQAAEFPYPANTRFVVENEPGIMRARMRGAREAKGDWIVFVDDDNLLAADYLDQAAAIIEKQPEITLFCGRIDGEFETEPPAWLKEFYPNLAIIEFEEDTFSRERDFSKIPSWTAGMVLRRSFALEYYQVVEKDPFRLSLKRCEDVDMAIWAATRSLLCGKFTSIHMLHIIPKARMDYVYIKKIVCETSFNMGRIHQRGNRSFKLRLRALLNAVKALFCLSGPREIVSAKRCAAWRYAQGTLKGE